jgi:hypothetical protein
MSIMIQLRSATVGRRSAALLTYCSYIQASIRPHGRRRHRHVAVKLQGNDRDNSPSTLQQGWQQLRSSAAPPSKAGQVKDTGQ